MLAFCIYLVNQEDTMNSKEMALSAETILLTERNLKPSLEWLRSIGLDAPDFPARCLHAPCTKRTLLHCEQ